MQTHRIETPEEVARTILRVASVIDPQRLWVTPDCGLNHLPRAIAFAKLAVLQKGAELVRAQYASPS